MFPSNRRVLFLVFQVNENASGKRARHSVSEGAAHRKRGAKQFLGEMFFATRSSDAAVVILKREKKEIRREIVDRP